MTDDEIPTTEAEQDASPLVHGEWHMTRIHAVLDGEDPEGEPLFTEEKWGPYTNYVCAGEGCPYATLDRAQIDAHVAHCGRIERR